MNLVGLKGHSWTSNHPILGPSRYLTVMDAIKFVVARKEKIISQLNS